MGWSSCGTDSKGRPIGYGHRGTCDQVGCKAKIDRGLGYACGGMHGTSPGCEGYFCGDHLTHRYVPEEQRGVQVCQACAAELDGNRAEAFRETLADITNASWTGSLDDVKRLAYAVLLEWDETEDLKPDPACMRPDQVELLTQRATSREMFEKMADEAAGEGATT